MRRTITNFRYVDIFGGVLLLLPTVLVAVALIIFNRIWNPGPLIYVQRRIGVMERPFFIYKFRTMIGDNTPGSFASENNCRITALGRLIRYLHFDELPQCLNVLRGDMSLVGPRPEQDIVHM
ncbi:MAG: sugar transferase, partial [Planktomarina sp.]